jgi:serine O-acetyltransferase
LTINILIGDGGGGVNPCHSGQYLIYLYFFSNVCSNIGEKNLADKLYYLNKIMHSVDIYHEVALPESFFFEHPVGTVLGRAKYGNKFFAMQNCTVGGNKGKYPIIGENVKLYSGAKILGNCIIGDNVSVSANTYIKDTDIPDDTIVFGTYPNLILKFLQHNINKI